MDFIDFMSTLILISFKCFE